MHIDFSRIRILVFSAFAALLLFGLAAFADEGEGPLREAQPTGTTPEEIIKKFAAKEKVFKQHVTLSADVRPHRFRATSHSARFSKPFATAW